MRTSRVIHCSCIPLALAAAAVIACGEGELPSGNVVMAGEFAAERGETEREVARDFELPPLGQGERAELIGRLVSNIDKHTRKIHTEYVGTDGLIHISRSYRVEVSADFHESDRVWELRERVRARGKAQEQFGQAWFGGDRWKEHPWNCTLLLTEVAGGRVGDWGRFLRQRIAGEQNGWAFAAMALGEAGPRAADAAGMVLTCLREYDTKAELRHAYAAAARMAPSDRRVLQTLSQRLDPAVPFNGDPGDAFFALAFTQEFDARAIDAIRARVNEAAKLAEELRGERKSIARKLDFVDRRLREMEGRDAAAKRDRQNRQARRLLGDPPDPDRGFDIRDYDPSSLPGLGDDYTENGARDLKARLNAVLHPHISRQLQFQASHLWDAALAGVFNAETGAESSSAWAGMLDLVLFEPADFRCRPGSSGASLLLESLNAGLVGANWVYGDALESLDSLARVLRERSAPAPARAVLRDQMLALLARSDEAWGGDAVGRRGAGSRRWTWIGSVSLEQSQSVRLVRQRCLEICGLLGDADAAVLDMLARYLQSEDVRLWFEAARAIGRLGHGAEGLIGALERTAREDFSPLVRETAAWSLERMSIAVPTTAPS